MTTLMPADCQWYFLFGGSQALSVADQMGGSPAVITGTVEYKQGYADFRAGGSAESPYESPSRDRTTLLVSTSSAAESVQDGPGGPVVWPPTLGPAEMRSGGANVLRWNGGAQFFGVSSGVFMRTESGDISTSTAQKSNDPIAYTDATFTPQFWGGGVITSPTLTTLLAPVGQGVNIITQPFSGTAAAASKTTIGNGQGVANSHMCIAAIAQFPAMTPDQALVRLRIMMADVSVRLGYSITRGVASA